MFLASDSGDVMNVNSHLITQRINQNNIKADILVPAYLDYRLDKRWLEWFTHSSIGATRKINRDFMPTAVFQMLVLWNKQFSPRLAYILEALGSLDLKVVLVWICAITFILFLIFSYKHNLIKLSITYSIATTGFFGMLINLILIFSFQIIYGYLYHRIGLLISIFMAGIALGSIYITNHLERIKKDCSSFIRLEIAVTLFSLLLALIITRFSNGLAKSPLIFMTLFFIPGFLMGLEFPLASKIYLVKSNKIGQTAGILYSADLLGGWLAGILGGIILLPVLGLFNACMVMVILKLSSLLLLLATNTTIN
jgi:spermidine synthase